MHNLISVSVQETVTSLCYPHIKLETVTSLFSTHFSTYNSDYVKEYKVAK
jgi:hypothetical protein